ncbi:AAA family ATPase [Planktothrix agardhii]|uniref:Endonuclease GajA/Old nuclease/RecF-like AAA domain-containing protein n=1 Tax=Planktothrix agardhii No758 TaxID=1964479 RepID=A0A1U9WXE7_PLAAG|nr:AAA family ATPase [Planktothrix agardhii]AQY60976.1 hypothetical protein [Planktothrix agardhii No758]CAD5972139.1 hypothetical protein NO758_03835 [Planktothrix agardhii]
MELLIKNFGPIKNNKQSIDLSKRFYVFVGYNNSGKTYVSQVLWAIFNPDKNDQFARQAKLENIQIELNRDIVIDQSLIDNILDQYAGFLEKEILNVFKIDKDSPLAKNISISFSCSIDKIEQSKGEAVGRIRAKKSQKIEYLLINKEEHTRKVKIEAKKLPSDSIPKNIILDKIYQDKNSELKSLKTFFVRFIIQLLINDKHKTVFLPSSRTFYPTFYKYIYDMERRENEELKKKLINIIDLIKNKDTSNIDLIEEAQDLMKSTLLKRPYTEPMNQVFETIFSLHPKIEIVQDYQHILEKLVKIMGGDVVMKAVEGLSPIEFYFRLTDHNLDLPMYLASSSVNQLTLLYLYLKYWVEKENNFLIIDEPEENLYPENQVRLLKLLIQFAIENNNKVLITTHSSIMAKAISNYISIDVLKEKYKLDVDEIIEENNLEYVDSKTSISQQDVGVYLFNGKKIIDYEADDYGVYFINFYSAIDSVEKSRKILTDYIYIKDSEK